VVDRHHAMVRQAAKQIIDGLVADARNTESPPRPTAAEIRSREGYARRQAVACGHPSRPAVAVERPQRKSDRTPSRFYNGFTEGFDGADMVEAKGLLDDAFDVLVPVSFAVPR
ncbi:MAG: hypothetical protein JOY71_11705, partial [Acetobacteraceae bacterium]|nr:hypothetical protein [Acetobacteraceae bacterium]